MIRLLTRRGRLSLTLVAIATVASWWGLRGCRSCAFALAIALAACVFAVGLAITIDEYRLIERLIRRIRTTKTKGHLTWK